MRAAVIATGVVVAVGVGVYVMPADLFGGGAQYPLTVAEAKALLVQADLRRGRQPFGTLDVRRSSALPGEIRYAVNGRLAAIDCRAALKPVGERGVDVATHCARVVSGADANAAATEQVGEAAFAEYVAAALGRRAFDDAKSGSTPPPVKAGAAGTGSEQPAGEANEAENGAADDADAAAPAAGGDEPASPQDGGQDGA